MNILVFGANGMLGHKLIQRLSHRFKVIGTLRGPTTKYTDNPVLQQIPLLGNVQVENFASVSRSLASAQPAVVINCVGIVKQSTAAHDPLISISVNALFPHRLVPLCRDAGIRLIHISTDCVFSGRKGNYIESDLADADDLYGRTKLLGELDYAGSLTLRTSMIGRELETTHGLIEWFLGQEGKTIKGFKRAIFSGFTTMVLAELIAKIIIEHPDMQGVWHVASEPISKFDLLTQVKKAYAMNIQIEPDNEVVCDRSLNSDRFQHATGYIPPSWSDMIEEMYNDSTPYDELRRSYAH